MAHITTSPNGLNREVCIQNPASGTGFTNRNRARRFVVSGRAQWISDSGDILGDGQESNRIRFLVNDHRHVAATISAVRFRPAWDTLSGCGYDRVDRTMSLQEMRNTPISNPERALWK